MQGMRGGLVILVLAVFSCSGQVLPGENPGEGKNMKGTIAFNLKDIAPGHQAAVLAGGCFWCTEAVYEGLPGVVRAVSGYTGGSMDHPDYQTVSTGTTGHAEAVLVEFDPKVITYRHILDIFWKAHDPTSLNRQGADSGTQYRSAVFTLDTDQETQVLQSIAGIQPGYDRKVVTTVQPLTTFWLAEEYHQDFYAKNPGYGYCAAVIKPKLDKLKLPRLKTS